MLCAAADNRSQDAAAQPWRGLQRSGMGREKSWEGRADIRRASFRRPIMRTQSVHSSAMPELGDLGMSPSCSHVIR